METQKNQEENMKKEKIEKKKKEKTEKKSKPIKAVLPKKISKVFEVITKEYKYENLVLLVAAVVALAFGVMILTGELDVRPEVPVIGEYPVVFAWILISVSALGLIIVAYPFYQPSFAEFGKITWASPHAFIVDFTRVFIFIIFISFTFLFFDIILKEFFGLING